MAPPLIGPLRTAARRSGITWRDLDLEGISDRKGFFRAVARALELPDYFGHNFDALHECLLDAVRESPGLVIHWRRGSALGRRSPQTVRTALEILRDAAMYGSSGGRTSLVVVERGSAPGIGLPPLR